MLVLNVGGDDDDDDDDGVVGGGRVCLFAEKETRPIALPLDASRAVCALADFATRGRGQLPFLSKQKSSRRRVTVLPCRTNAAVRWTNFVAAESPTQWAKCTKCFFWHQLDQPTSDDFDDAWVCAACDETAAGVVDDDPEGAS